LSLVLQLPKLGVLSRPLWACVVLLLFPYFFLTDLTGPVISPLDGDTIEVLHNQRAERIRLNGIDCPEKGQAFGTRTTQAASELVFGKEVTP
jgi:endonuclease YncB( thermonuclease family)